MNRPRVHEGGMREKRRPCRASRSPDHHRHRLIGSTRGTVPHTISEQHGLALARVTIAGDCGHELPGHPGPLRDPGERDAPHLDLPGRQAPGSPAAARHKGMHARLSAGRQAGNRRQRDPSVAVRGEPAVTPTALPARNPSAMRPWTTAYPVEVDTYGLPDSKGGLTPVVGFPAPRSSIPYPDRGRESMIQDDGRARRVRLAGRRGCGWFVRVESGARPRPPSCEGMPVPARSASRRGR
jgi:hypothetical protein